MVALFGLMMETRVPFAGGVDSGASLAVVSSAFAVLVEGLAVVETWRTDN